MNSIIHWIRGKKQSYNFFYALWLFILQIDSFSLKSGFLCVEDCCLFLGIYLKIQLKMPNNVIIFELFNINEVKFEQLLLNKC